MKKISTVFFLIAIGLLVWGAADFFHYAVIGDEIMRHYNEAEIVQELVNDSLLQGLVKAAAGLAIIGCLLLAGKRRDR